MTRDGSTAAAAEEGAKGSVPSPKDRFTALDTLAVVRELRALDRARVDKAFDLLLGGWSVVLRVPGEGRRELVLVPGRFAALVPVGPEHSEELSPLAREIRRILTGASIASVAEPEGERYLELELTRGSAAKPMRLALEMFGAGNLVVAEGDRIAAVAAARRWAHRVVRVGADYARPPTRTDPWRMDAAEVGGVLSASRTDLASTLAARLSLGGPVAEELIARAGWTADAPAASLTDHVPSQLREELARLAAEVGDRPMGYLYREGEVPVDATPYRSARWAHAPGVEESVVPTFSEAALVYFQAVVTRPPSAQEKERSRAAAEQERLLVRQRAAVEELADAIAERKAVADAILAHYAEAEAALRDAGDEAPDGSVPVVLTVEGRTIELDRRRSPRETAQLLYEEAKRLGTKLDGARAALASSLERGEGEPLGRGGPELPAASPPRRTFWFEKYRWFVSSEGTIVIAGRDAGSNDLVVRRNLRATDLYVHADLHGAASVVVKRPTEATEIGTPTIEEAAQWAVAFSKAWRAGLASANAFWVRPDQVSKAAASGEFVARGAWVVHGTKNFLRDLPLELALGTVRYEGEERWTAAPERSVRSRGDVRALLVPGEERDRAEVERSLAKELGVSRSLLQSLLPAGGVSVRRA
jgi:predicted ribosome quality control (RQC) complex YloA/Tae2 family protein